MMVKPCSKQPKINRAEASSMKNQKISKLKLEEPDHHLSGAYIRSLVKHLTSTKPITANEKLRPDSNGESIIDHNNNTQLESPPAVKKQVRRRRRHTGKPYQERLLNMAEARREIVTALKFHRASMKQRETAYPQVEQSSTNIVAADLFSNFLDSNLSCSPRVPYSYYYYSPVSGRTDPPPPPPPPLNHQNLDLTVLPNQTLGLNLNFQDFINLDANLYHNPLSNYPTSSLSSSSSSTNSFPATISLRSEEIATRVPEKVVPTSTTTSSSSSSSSSSKGDLHQVMDDEGMEEIRSLGDQHQIEWNDTMNLMASARWFKFLKNIEIQQEDGRRLHEMNPFSQVIEYNPPCMDIGEIEVMDGEWLA